MYIYFLYTLTYTHIPWVVTVFQYMNMSQKPRGFKCKLSKSKLGYKSYFFGNNSHRCKLCPNQDLGCKSYFLVTDLDPILITVNSVFHTMDQRIQLAKGIVCREEGLVQKQTLRLIGAKEQRKPFFHNTSKNDYLRLVPWY